MATAIMKQKEVPEMDDVEEIISKISEDSPYKRRPTQKRTWMTVPEMGKLLGLKKTDRYWLVHKNVFESKEIAGKIRINIASFEKWYANQIKYHKVTGEEPGKELKSWSYSVKEVADLLGVDEYLVYDLLKKNQMEAVIVDYWNRNGKPMKQKPKLKEEKKKLNIKKRWDHLSSVNAKHWTSLLQNMLHCMEKKTGRFLHMKGMSLLSTTIFFRSLVIQSSQRSIPDSSKDIIRVF